MTAAARPRRATPAATARALVSEVARSAAPRSVLVIGDDEAVRAELARVLTPDDRWCRWDGRGAPPADAHGCDALVLTRGAPAGAALVEVVRERLDAGAALSLVVPAGRRGRALVRDLTGDAGGRHDLLLRGAGPVPVPVRVQHLRRAPVAAAALGLAPVRRPSSVRFGPVGVDSTGVACAGLVAGAAVGAGLRGRRRWALAGLLLGIPLTAFFRDPDRAGPEQAPDPDAVVAAADGRVLAVEQVTEPGLGPAGWTRISVFLSVLDVHINRAPVAGVVTEVRRESGGHAMAQRAAAEHNQACYTTLDTVRGPVVTVQRTGLIARRIVNRTRPRQPVARGERTGLIRFGSRTDVYLPAGSVDVTVAPGDRVVGGETVIARYR